MFTDCQLLTVLAREMVSHIFASWNHLEGVIENLEDLSIDEVIEQFDVTREQITVVLDFVAESLRNESIPTGARPL